MTNCYALLQDGLTIKFFDFDSDTRWESSQMRLNERVKCSSPYGFHVTEFGMAICDDEKNEVRYYHNVQSPNASCIIKAPTNFKGASPVCVTSQRKDKKWCVVWQKKVAQSLETDTDSVAHSRIYQYSRSFQDEYLLLGTDDTICSLGVLNDEYMCTQGYDEHNRQRIHVYYIQSKR